MGDWLFDRILGDVDPAEPVISPWEDSIFDSRRRFLSTELRLASRNASFAIQYGASPSLFRPITTTSSEGTRLAEGLITSALNSPLFKNYQDWARHYVRSPF